MGLVNVVQSINEQIRSDPVILAWENSWENWRDIKEKYQKLFSEQLSVGNEVSLRKVGIKEAVAISKLDSPEFLLYLRAHNDLAGEELTSLLTDFAQRIKTSPRRLTRRARIGYDLHWNLEDFQRETNLRGLFFDRVNLLADRTVEGDVPHNVYANSRGRTTTLSLSGDYFMQRDELLDILQPQKVKIRLESHDAQKVEERLRDATKGLFAGVYKKAFAQKKGPEYYLLGLPQRTEVVLPIGVLQIVREIIAKPLYGHSYAVPDQRKPNADKTGIVEFMRTYSFLELIYGRKLEDLQRLASTVETINDAYPSTQNPQLSIKVTQIQKKPRRFKIPKYAKLHSVSLEGPESLHFELESGLDLEGLGVHARIPLKYASHPLLNLYESALNSVGISFR